MRRKNLWRDKDGNYLPSKCSQKFLDKIEFVFGCRIEREYKLEYGFGRNEVRYYDGRYKDYLIELDGSHFHRTKRQKRNDKLKNSVAEMCQFKLLRLPLDSSADVDRVFAENLTLLQEIFEEKGKVSANIIDKLQEVA